MANYFEKPWLINPFIVYPGLLALFIIFIFLLIIAFLYDLIMAVVAIFPRPFLKKYPHFGKFTGVKDVWEIIHMF